MPSKAPLGDLIRTVGTRLGEALDYVGASQVEIAMRASKLAGLPISTPSLSRFLSGSRGMEAARLLGVLKASAELDVSLDHVIHGSGPVRRTAVLAERAELLAELAQAIAHLPAASQKQNDAAREAPPTRKRRS